MEDPLSQVFDVAVIGTGLAPSIVAAAASRIGRTVVHIDSNSFYGQTSATLCPADLVAAASQSTCDPPLCSPAISNLEEEIVDQKAYDSFSRRWSIDILPRLCFSRGALVDLLISSNISRYLDFKAITEMSIHDGKGLHMTPCSKAALMKDRMLSPRDKRLLVRFLQKAGSESKAQELAPDLLLDTYLSQEAELTDTLHSFVSSSMAWSTAETSARAGMQALQVFLASIGVFSPTPFILPMYGSSEINQAFCRLSAVYGGVYLLAANKLDVSVNSEQEHVIAYQDDITVRAKQVVCPSFALSAGKQTSVCRLSAVCRRPPPGIDMSGQAAHLVSLPCDPNESRPWCRVLVLASDIGTVNDGHYVVHLTMPHVDGWRETMNEMLNKLYHIDGKDKQEDKKSDTEEDSKEENEADNQADSEENAVPAVWKCSFVCMSETETSCEKKDSTLLYSPLGDQSISFERDVALAKEMFKLLFPDEEFLPPAPNPDDVVFERDDDTERIEKTTKYGTSYIPLAHYTMAEDGSLLPPADTCKNEGTEEDKRDETEA